MARSIAVVVSAGVVATAAAVLVMARSGRAQSPVVNVTTAVGPSRFVSPHFGYSVAYREVWRGDTAETTVALFVYEAGRWSNVTPPALHADAIDDVAFTDRRHGWVAAYDCGDAAVHLYRTSNAGRSWRSLGRSATHSCGGGPTFLSFVNPRDGWMEPVSPNGPGGELLRTNDGGVFWSLVASLTDQNPKLPCLAPITFTSRSTGWMGHSTSEFHDSKGRLCAAHVYQTNTAGRTWQAHAIRIPRSSGRLVLDVPRFFGRSGVVAATVGGESARAVPRCASSTRSSAHTCSRKPASPRARTPFLLHLQNRAFWPDWDGTVMEQRGRKRWQTFGPSKGRKQLDLARNRCHWLPPAAVWIAW